MASYTAVASGNWSLDTNWSPVGVPGDGDDVSISGLAIDMDVDTTIGASGVAGTVAINLSANIATKLTVKQDVNLVLRGRIQLNMAAQTLDQLAFEDGSTLTFDSSQAVSPSTTPYDVWWVATNGLAPITFSGTAQNRITVTSNPGGANGYFAFSGNFDGPGEIDASYTDFSDLGNATTPAFAFRPRGVADWTWVMDHCTLDNCYEISTTATLGGVGTFSITNTTWTNTLSTTPLAMVAFVSLTTGTRLLQGNVFDQLLTGQYADFSFLDNILLDAVNVTITADKWAAFERNLLRKTPTSPNDLHANGDIRDNYVVLDGAMANVHLWTLNGANPVVTGNIVDANGLPDGEGDLLIPAASVTATVIENIVLPVSGETYGCGALVVLLADTGPVTVDHNTAFGKLMNVGEGFAGTPGQVESCKSNAVWNDGAATSVNMKINDFQGVTVDLVPAANATNNAGWNLDTGSNGKAYDNLQLSAGSLGAADIEADPMLVNGRANMATWDASLGGPGTFANAIAELGKLNDADYDPAYSVTALLAYITGKQAPKNPAYNGTGHDGEDIGAVPVVAIVSQVRAANVVGQSILEIQWTEVPPP